MESEIISIDVECPWCGAKPGEPCTEGMSGPPYVRTLLNRGHLARTAPNPNPPADPLAPS